MANQKKILILGNSHLVVFKFRGELIERLVSLGHDVWVCFPNGPFGEGQETADRCGCHFIENKIDRRGTNPLSDLKVFWDYFQTIQKLRPDVVLTYTVKPDVYGGIACRLLKVPCVINITGLGKGLDEGGLVAKITAGLYKAAAKNAACTFFQNASDQRFFDTHGIRYRKGALLPGSGVNLEKFTPLEYPAATEPIRFIYVARVMKAKGIEQFLEAAHAIRQMHPTVEFHICGYCEEDYKGIIKEKAAAGEVIYHGLVEDVMEYEKRCHCVVLPSFHPEGISNVLLEGAACARPLITTDHAGCRETVDDGVTGYIVKQQDSRDLIEKMERFIALPHGEKAAMGLAARQKVQREFDRNIVVEEYMKIINQL